MSLCKRCGNTSEEINGLCGGCYRSFHTPSTPQVNYAYESSRMEPHTVKYSGSGITVFTGPLWAALEYVRAAGEPSSGGYWIVKKVEGV